VPKDITVAIILQCHEIKNYLNKNRKSFGFIKKDFIFAAA
jgi:hypothetical protein